MKMLVIGVVGLLQENAASAHWKLLGGRMALKGRCHSDTYSSIVICILGKEWFELIISYLHEM
ncbi:hypothetical protein BFP97_19055 [Roseivirga sp. 4D4]|nr:hypothetical protein BFP97_19055 [Roseivirga sp. 4D4]